MLERGIKISIISSILGHNSANFTMRVYTHDFDKTNAEGNKIINETVELILDDVIKKRAKNDNSVQIVCNTQQFAQKQKSSHLLGALFTSGAGGRARTGTRR